MNVNDFSYWIQTVPPAVLIAILDELHLELCGRDYRLEGLLVDQARILLHHELTGEPMKGMG